MEGLKVSEDKKKYIMETLNPILEEMVTECLIALPDDPATFLVDWLSKKKGISGSGGGGGAMAEENANLKKEVEKLKAQLNASGQLIAASGGGGGGADEKDDEEEEEDEEDDVVDEIPESFKKPEGQMKAARASVSAEAYGAWNQKKAFTPPVYAKSEDQKRRLKDVLGKSFLFQALQGSDDFSKVVDAMKEKIAEPKERVINQGDNGDFLFVIETGTLDCYIKKPDGSEIKVKTCEAGDAFGELALLYNCPRAASVEASERCVLWELDRETFNYIVKEAAAKKRERYEKFLTSVPLLNSMDVYERSQVCDALKSETFGADQTIMTEGEAGDKFYIVEEGECYAMKGGNKVMDYKVGDYFGELALLRNQPRAATIKCAGPAKVLALDRRTFKRLLGPLEDLLKQKVYS